MKYEVDIGTMVFNLRFHKTKAPCERQFQPKISQTHITTSTRIGQLAKEKTTPRNRDEREIAGYRDVLNTIHENYEYVPVNGNIILFSIRGRIPHKVG